MNRVIKILMDRDNITESEARDMIAECRNDIYMAMDDGCPSDIDDIIMHDLGLEPDYLFDII